MRLTRNFTLEEMTASDTARRFSIGNEPKPEHVANLRLLCENVLQPLRDAWGGPITVNSGFRSAAVNKTVGGVTNSQHLQGQAADITVGNPARNHELFQMAIDLDLPFDQLIDEQDFAWIHVSYSPRHRRQVLHLK